MQHQLNHFKALMQKNYLQSKRNLLYTILEVLTPILLILVFCLLSLQDKPQKREETSQIKEYPSFLMYPRDTPNKYNLEFLYKLQNLKLLGGNKKRKNKQDYSNPSKKLAEAYKPIFDKFKEASQKIFKREINQINKQFHNDDLKLSFQNPILQIQNKRKVQIYSFDVGIAQELIDFQYEINNIPNKMFKDKFKILENYDDQLEVLKYFQSEDYIAKKGMVTHMIEINSLEISNSMIIYDQKLRFKQDQSIKTQTLFNPTTKALDASQSKLLMFGQLNLQQILDKFLMKKIQDNDDVTKKSNNDLTDNSIMVYQSPQRDMPFTYSLQLFISKSQMPLAIVATYLLPVISIVRKIVTEKETLAKAGMKLMGLSDLIQYLSYWVWYSLYQFIVAAIMTLILISFVYTNVSFLLMFLTLFAFGVQSVVFTTMLSTFFKRSYIAIVFTMFTQFLSYQLTLLQDNENKYQPAFKISLGSLMPTVSLNWGFNWLSEMQGAGEQIMLTSARTQVMGYRLSDVWVSQTLSIFGFAFLTWYFDKVLPSTNDNVKKPWFIFSNIYKKFFKPKKVDHNEEQQRLLGDDIANINNEKDIPFEPYNPIELNTIEKSIQIRNLSKFQKTKDVQALNDVSFDILQDQISVLLGPNGAGKSTMMNILIGNLAQSAGIITYKDENFEDQVAAHPSTMGICPQYNIIFQSLTVFEHLYLFSIFKGLSATQYEPAIATVNKDLRLHTFMDKQAENLSGGQKRRLAISIALIGDCEFVVLDEPTAGLDPTSKRELWDLLKKTKFGRKLLMSTHYMDEAEQLGDRVAIIDFGNLQCMGSTTFLRETQCNGTSLEIAQDKVKGLDQFDSFLAQSGIDYEKNQIKSDKFCYTIMQKKDVFVILKQFEDLNIDAHYNIRDYNVSQTKLDDIFFRIIRKNRPTPVLEEAASGPVNAFDEAQKTSLLTQFQSNIKKNFLQDSRDLMSISCEIIFPVLFIIAGITISNVGLDSINSIPAINFNWYQQLSAANNNIPLPQTLNIKIHDNELMDQEKIGSFLAHLQNNDSLKLNVVHEDSQNDFTQFFDSMNTFDKEIQDKFSNSNKIEKDAKPMANIQIFSNSPTDTFSDLGIEGNLWFFHVEFDTAYPFAIPTIQSMLNSAIIKSQLQNDSIELQIDSIYSPLPLTYENRQKFNESDQIIEAFNNFCCFGFAIFMVGLVQFQMNEKEREMKNLLMLSGLNPGVQWVSNLAQDLLKYILTCSLILLVIRELNIQTVQQFEFNQLQAFIFSLICLSVPLISLVQMTSLYFSTTGNAMLFVLVFFSTVSAMLSLMQKIFNNEDIRDMTNNIIDQFWFQWAFSPLFNFHQAIDSLQKAEEDALDWDCTGKWNAINVGIGIGQQVLVLLCEKYSHISVTASSLFGIKLKDGEAGEDDLIDLSQTKVDSNTDNVDKRRDRTNEKVISMRPMEADIKAIETQNIMKQQGNSLSVDTSNRKLALKGVTFNVEAGECFVMLGSNGAGKTTLFKILMSEVMPTSGSVCIGGLQLNSQNLWKIRQQIGYCPQMNSNYTHLTVVEHLNLILSVKNIPTKHHQALVTWKLKELDLQHQRDYLTHTLSGGNQRKLNQAIASICNPKLLFLDEPTSSMDPISRKNINENIVMNKQASHTIFQCTHIIDEAEFVSDRIAIMINGKLRAVGPAMALKNQFGNEQMIWVSLDMSLCSLDPDVRVPSELGELFSQVEVGQSEAAMQFEQTKAKVVQIMQWVKSKNNNFQVDEVKFNMFKIKIDKESQIKVSALFQIGEEMQDEFGFVKSISIDSINLEEIFWNLNQKYKSDN